jgi:hypothetical protein
MLIIPCSHPAKRQFLALCCRYRWVGNHEYGSNKGPFQPPGDHEGAGYRPEASPYNPIDGLLPQPEDLPALGGYADRGRTYWIELLTEEKTLLAPDPINRIVPTTTARITASITAYSATSWPSSSHNLPKAQIIVSSLCSFTPYRRLTPTEQTDKSDGMIMSSVQCFAA